MKSFNEFLEDNKDALNRAILKNYGIKEDLSLFTLGDELDQIADEAELGESNEKF